MRSLLLKVSYERINGEYKVCLSKGIKSRLESKSKYLSEYSLTFMLNEECMSNNSANEDS